MEATIELGTRSVVPPDTAETQAQILVAIRPEAEAYMEDCTRWR